MKMKSIFKKAISVLCAAAVVATCFSSSIFAFAEDINIALVTNGATPISSGQRNGSQSEAKINDGTNDGFFGANVNNVDAQGTVYFGVKWEENKTFGDLKIYWRDTNHGPATDAYTIEYSVDGTAWQEISATKVRESISKEDMQTLFGNLENQSRIAYDTVTLASDVTAKAVRIVANTTGLSQVQMYEFQVYGSAAGGNEESAHTPTYTKGANLAHVNTGATGFAINGMSATGGNRPAYINDGEASTSAGSNNGSRDFTAGVVFAETSSFNEIVVNWESSVDTGKYVIKVSTDTTNGTDGTWTELTGISPERDGSVDTIALENPVTAKGIAVFIAGADVSTTRRKIRELEVYNVVVSFSEPATQYSSAAVSGDATLTDRLIVTNIDKNAVAGGKVIKATFTITREGVAEPAVDTIELDAAWKSVSLTVGGNETTIDATDLGGTADQYVTGFILRDLLATDTVTVEFSVE